MFGDPQKRAAALVVAIHPPSSGKDEAMGPEGLRACMRDLMECLKSGDESGAAEAFMSAFQMCESQPHDEGDAPGDAA